MIEVDVDHQISSVERRVGGRTLDAGEARSVTISRTYDAPIESVWDACTNPERIPRWFLPITGDLRVGGRYQLEGNAGGVVERCDPPTSFAATWEHGGNVTWIELRLTPDGDGRTRFALEHIARVDDEGWLQYGPGGVGVGWDLLVISLGLHLASGAAVDPAEFAAWSGSDNGKTFMTRSSDGWCQATITAGADPDEATAAAARVTAAYTASP